MNGAASASLSNMSSQQIYGNGGPSDASPSASPYQSSNNPADPGQDSFGKESCDQQKPKKKSHIGAIIATIVGVSAAVGLGFLTRSAIRNGHIAEQIAEFKPHTQGKIENILNSQFAVKEGGITYEAKEGVTVTHPKAYSHMLAELLSKDEAGQTQHFADLKMDDHHKAALRKWLKTNEIKKESASS